MFRPTLRIASSAPSLGRAASRAASRRFASTAPPQKTSRSWKNGAARWALAGGLVYYYNTATVFAEEPVAIHTPPESSRENEQYDTIASISEQRRAQSRSQAAPVPSKEQSHQTVQTAHDGEATASGSPEALEEEAEQQGAFNEETGEINWDCPCLGGMAYGPCGEEFRAAFSCFVFSKEEPKGVDCIDKFKGMQNCFREHPEIYGGELDDEGEEGAAVEQEEGRAVSVARDPAEEAPVEALPGQAGGPVSTAREQVKERVEAATEQVRAVAPVDESSEVVPKAWHDTRSANGEKK